MKNQDRLERERAFHDGRFGGTEDPRKHLNKYYSVNKDLEAFYKEAVSSNCKGLELLEYGCGRGEKSRIWVEMGAKVTGIDISPEGIRKAKKRASKAKYQASYFVMDAENTTFDDATFDIVVGSGIIHHLDIIGSYQELARLLKPNGHMVFSEPLGSNPAINLYRWLTPNIRTADEHPLTEKDLKLLSEYFYNVEVEYFTLSTLLAVPFRKTSLFNWAHKLLASFDKMIFKVPFLRKLAWMVVIHAFNPK